MTWGVIVMKTRTNWFIYGHMQKIFGKKIPWLKIQSAPKMETMRQSC